MNPCKVCGKPTKKKTRQTCSYACSNTLFRSGKNNPNWKDERYSTTCALYHKMECIVCGEKNIVAVHHFDENHSNNSPENLMPLCPTHHTYVHSKFKHLVIDIIVKYRNEFIKFGRG